MKTILVSPIALSKHPDVLARWVVWTNDMVRFAGVTPYFLLDGEGGEEFQKLAKKHGGKVWRVEGEMPWPEDNAHHSRRVAWLREQMRQCLLKEDWDLALWVDCDTFLPLDALTQLKAALTECKVQAASGLVPDRMASNNVVIALNEEYLAMPAGLEREKAPKMVQWTGMGCLLMTRAALTKQGWAGYGPVDMHGYPRHGEDTWWCRELGTGVALALDCVCQHADNDLSMAWCAWEKGTLAVGRRQPMASKTKIKKIPAVQYVGGGKARHPFLGRVVMGESIVLTPEIGEKFGEKDLWALQKSLCFYGNPPDENRPNGQFIPTELEEPTAELDIR